MVSLLFSFISTTLYINLLLAYHALKDAKGLGLNKTLQILRVKCGEPESNVKKWIKKESELHCLWSTHTLRKKKAFGCGRTPLFPKTEKLIGDEIRKARSEQKMYSKGI